MQTQTSDIVAALLAKLPDPTVGVYQITMQDLVTAIVRRVGDSALLLTPDDLLLAREEVQAAIGHHLDEREFIDMGLDAWQLVRQCEET